MNQAPSGLLPVLPADWCQRGASFQVNGPFRHLVDVLREVVLHHDERSLATREVQLFVLTICEHQPDAFAAATNLPNELEQAVSGDWPITDVLAEYALTTKQPWHIAKDLESIEAEWIVLHKSVCERGWSAVWRQRDVASRIGGRHRLPTTQTIDLDAKYKQGAGAESA